MTDRYCDEDLSGMLPDYLSNNLDPSARAEVTAYLARNTQATIDLENLRLIMDELHHQEISVPPAAVPGLQEFLAHATSHPLHRHGKKPASWLARLAIFTQSWGRPAFAVALMVIVGQSAIIANLAATGPEQYNAPGLTRSLTQDGVTGRMRGPVLAVEIVPSASFAALMDVVRDVGGTIVLIKEEGNIMHVELAAPGTKDAIARLRQSKLVRSVTEIVSLDPGHR